MALVSKLRELIPWRRKETATLPVEVWPDEGRWAADRLPWSPLFSGWPLWSDWPLSGRWLGVELEETDDAVVIRAEVPGIDPKDLRVDAREGQLRIHYEQHTERRNGLQGGRRVEMRYRFFDNSLTLPTGLDLDLAKATCKHGVLTIRIPWSEDRRGRVRPIPISS